MTHKDEEGNEVCCPRFDPSPWDEKIHHWDNKLFIKDSVPQFLHIPLPMMYSKKVSKMWNMIQEAHADPEIKDFLLLAYDPSPWKSELYMSTTKEVPGAENVRLSGTFLTKVFDGPYNAVPSWIPEMDEYVEKQGKKVKKYYLYYTTCPKCAKKYGHNYAVMFAEIE
ncbi:hypothetical protein JW710_01030 [Candidatus Dojkabacteria bacterium]|nr:hypothetical protein [Candidatus Dojkabacteria bacterium]